MFPSVCQDMHARTSACSGRLNAPVQGLVDNIKRRHLKYNKLATAEDAAERRAGNSFTLTCSGPRPTSTMSITCRNSSMRKRRQSTFLHLVQSSPFLHRNAVCTPSSSLETNQKPNSDERCVFITDDCVDPCAVRRASCESISTLRANIPSFRFRF